MYLFLQVACRQMGFTGGYFYDGNDVDCHLFGNNPLEFWLDDVTCSGKHSFKVLTWLVVEMANAQLRAEGHAETCCLTEKRWSYLLEEIWGADWLPLHIKLDPYNLGIVVEGKPSWTLYFAA